MIAVLIDANCISFLRTIFQVQSSIVQPYLVSLILYVLMKTLMA